MQQTQPTQPRLTTIAAAAGLVAIFYFGREVLIPLALAVLIAFLLAPMARRFEGWGMRRVMAVALTLVVAITPVAGIGWIVGVQFADLATTLPEYQGRIEQKLDSVKGPAGSAISRITRSLRELSEEATLEDPAEDAPAPAEPMPVRIVDDPLAPVTLAGNLLRPIARPFATAGIVIVFVLVILIQREDLRDRVIRLIGPRHLSVTTQALDELAGRVSRFLRMQFLVNLSYGVAAAIGLTLIGVPGAAFWGFMCMALRFIPYLGPIVGAAMPIIVSLAVSDGWAMPIEVSIFFIIIELLSNNIVEPWLYGRNTGVSVLAVLVAAVFWTWLWGLPGLLLSTPMTVCFVVAGRHVPSLAFLHILLGDQPVLPTGARIYQRLLAMDSDEALEIADAYLKDHSLQDFFSLILLDVLGQIGQERELAPLEPARDRAIADAITELIDDAAADQPTPPPAPNATRTLCIPARDDADAAGARMLAHLLTTRGLPARAMSLEDLGSDLAQIIADFNPGQIVVASVQPRASARARLRLRQIARKAPGVPVMVGLYGIDPASAPGSTPGSTPEAAHARLRSLGASEVHATLHQSVTRIAHHSIQESEKPARPPAPPHTLTSLDP